MADENFKYVEAYNDDMRRMDEDAFAKAEQENKIDFKAFSRLMLNDVCVNTNVLNTGCIGDINLKDIAHALKYPSMHWRLLLAASEQLMLISPYYYRLNTLYSNMAVFLWGVDVDAKENANVNTIKKTYKQLASKLEDMHLKHEFAKIMRCLPYQDIYCGLVVENQTDFFFQKIDYRICRLYQVQDGMYNFQINLSSINQTELAAYPDYVQDAYIEFKTNESKTSNWYAPPADKQICIKMNSQWTFPYPMLIALVRDILDLDTYKKLKLQSARVDNYKAIMIKVPIDDTKVDAPLLTPEALSVFAEINRDSMTDDIGLLHILGDDGEAISFKDSSNARNNVADAVDELYNSSGLPKDLFNGSSTSTAITMSVENDSGYVYYLYRQFERWTNRFIKIRKYNKSTFKFVFYLLDATIYNKDTVSKRYMEKVSLGFPVIDKVIASLDMTPARLLGAQITHNEIFDYYNTFKPLMSVYNASASEVAAAEGNKGGRPAIEEGDGPLSDEGEKTRDLGKNDK